MNKLKDGEEYEKYILNIIKDKYKICYLWKDIPKDILCKNYYKIHSIIILFLFHLERCAF
jgi:hypothetical protein